MKMLFSGENTVGKNFTLPPAVTVVRNLTSASGLYFYMFVITGFNQIFNKVCGKGKNHLDTSGGDGNSHLGQNVQSSNFNCEFWSSLHSVQILSRRMCST